MNVVIAASECVPFAKTGGLADVVGALPGKIARLGHDIRVVLPYYRQTKKGSFNIASTGVQIEVLIGEKMVAAEIFSVEKNGVKFYFVDNDDYYDRDQLYSTDEGDYLDNAERFIFFSKAVLETLKAMEFKPQIIHCHDWQTGLVPVLIDYMRPHEIFFSDVSTVFTIHNLAYQGQFWHLDMPMTNLPWSYFTPEGIEYYEKLNLIKGGIVFADVVNTVSEKYSQEIQTPEYGCGLDGVLRAKGDRLFGILNGVDYDQWGPEKDQYLVANYSLNDPAGKKECRKDLLKEYGLRLAASKPLISIISRLVDQKGFDLIGAKIEKIMQLDIGLILLGTGDQKYHKLFERIAKKYPKKAGIKLGFDNKLAHKIEAGSDMFLMPSKYEPCGLNQIYSLRYGTVPIVRATGGLDDTIIDFDPATSKGNGFKFNDYTGQELLKTLKRAVKLFADNKMWRKLMENGMSCDFSWDTSAQKYVKLYQTAANCKKCVAV